MVDKFFVIDAPDSLPEEVEAEDHADAARIVYEDWLRNDPHGLENGGTLFVKKENEDRWKQVQVVVDYDPTVYAYIVEDETLQYKAQV